MHNISNVNNVLVKYIQLAAVNPKDAAILFASIYNNYLKTSGSVSYTHLDVYKRQIFMGPARHMARLAVRLKVNVIILILVHGVK